MNQFSTILPDGAVFCLSVNRKKKPVSWAWVEYIPEPRHPRLDWYKEERVNAVNLLDIITPEHLQRRGYASEVIAMLQDTHNSITTNASFTTSAGAMLLLKTGFKKTTNKAKGNTYVWTKEKEKEE